MEPYFQVGQLVSLRADRSRSGPVVEILPPAGGEPRYRVFHAAGDVWVYDQDQLEALSVPWAASGPSDAVAAGRFLPAPVFQARLTAARLARPQVDSLYALHAARIQFIPFQLKPLLRFTHADRPRLFIADEVGVGKTIEAGLILKELETRQQVDNVLVVCPKALVPKWRAEMRRFDEEFRVLTAETLRYCLDETMRDGGIWPSEYSRAIGPLELLRMAPYLDGTQERRLRPGLRTLDPPPQFSLVIVDEAHHVRNPGTSSQELARLLCDLSEAVVFLSATPVHVGSSNLFHLLNLLRPDLFPDEAVFDDILEPNKHITNAMRHVRFRNPAEGWQSDAAAALSTAVSTSWGRTALANDALFRVWLDRLRRRDVRTVEDRIRCLRDLEEAHSLANVMNRTRRRDIGRFTLREPHTVAVPFTAEQEELYHALIDFRRDVLMLDYDAAVVRLITDTLERQAASCLPALAANLDRVLQTGTFRLGDLTDALDTDEDEVGVVVPLGLRQRAEQVAHLAAALPPADPKMDRLRSIVEGALAEDGPGKVLVFSFFLHTLSYLSEKLRDAGYRVGVITGRVPDDEREALRDRFRLARWDPQALDVLLSSEVGCEGLDYEFCDRMVNYDIPWNPMRIEQRIGRIDRYGQQAEKIFIFNFITPDTVEERIFFRCFERLGVFRDTVGDLEDVLGDMVQELSRAAMDPALTAEQAEVKACQAADNAVRLMEERRRLEEQGADLLGVDYLEEVETLLAEGKYVSPNEIWHMVASYLASPPVEGRIMPDRQRPGVFRLVLRKEGRTELDQQLRSLGHRDRQYRAFGRWLQGNEPELPVTFDQPTALQHRDLSFITPVHPLAKLAIAYWEKQSEPLAARLQIVDQTVPAGEYVFVCDLWESLAIKPELKLLGFAYDLERNSISAEVSADLVRLLMGAQDAPGLAVPKREIVERAIQALDQTAHRRRMEEVVALRTRNDALVARRLGSLQTYFQNRLQRITGEVRDATNERIERMKRAEFSRVEQDFVHKQAAITARRQADIVSRRLAAGILEVAHAE